MDAAFSAATRAADLRAMTAEPLDVLVIGGGITGAGAARDAAMRGLRTGVVEAGDFAQGTSSRSSCLIHGGLRYLEHGWFRLVFEASRERRVLARTAPHLVWPRAFVFPIHRGGRVRLWQIWGAVWLYDLLAVLRNLGRHRLLLRAGVLRREPQLREKDLLGGAQYFDAQCDDARLTLATVRSAHRHGARCASYVRVTALEKAGGRVRGAHVEDLLTGERHTILAHAVINATGPWADEVRRLDDPRAEPILRLTRGAHVTVPRERAGNAGAVTCITPIDGRVMFLLPWGDVTLVGTTDTDTDLPPDDCAPDADDVTYLLRSANALFPAARLGAADVIASWAGLRPLLRSGDGATGAVPREHRTEVSPSGLITIVGGKLTTYRVMGAEVVDAAARALHRLDGRHVPRSAPTDREPLPGGEIADLPGLAQDLVGEGMPAPVAEHLARTYGAEATAVAHLAAADPALAEPLLVGGPWIAAEVVHQARREMALSVADVLVRRLHVFHRVRGHGLEAAPRVAALLAGELSWDAAGAEQAVAAYRLEVERMQAPLLRRSRT